VANTWKLTVEVKESNKKDKAEIMTGNIDDDILNARIAGQIRNETAINATADLFLIQIRPGRRG
jgi:hypothetical protein